jgi:hypothetical protein
MLLQADPGRASELAAYVGRITEVRSAALTSGPYDVIAQVDNTADLEHVLTSTKRAPGLARLCVCRSA